VGKNWPNGTALVATYARSLLPIANGTTFPAVPDVNSFVNLGLNGRPVFFGCDSGNTSASASASGSAPTALPPLVVYIPNAPYSYMSNVSTFQMDYDNSERAGIIENGYNVGMYSCSLLVFSSLLPFFSSVEQPGNSETDADKSPLILATMGNGTANSQWPTCVGCAILHRSLSKAGAAMPEVCEACFREFCWDGSLAAEETTYNPGLKLASKETESETSGAVAWHGDWYRILGAVLAVCFVMGA
jgi:lysophospholipase